MLDTKQVNGEPQHRKTCCWVCHSHSFNSHLGLVIVTKGEALGLPAKTSEHPSPLSAQQPRAPAIPGGWHCSEHPQKQQGIWGCRRQRAAPNNSCPPELCPQQHSQESSCHGKIHCVHHSPGACEGEGWLRVVGWWSQDYARPEQAWHSFQILQKNKNIMKMQPDCFLVTLTESLTSTLYLYRDWGCWQQT